MTSCTKTVFKDSGELLDWLEKEENGLVKVKYINGVMIKIKYLPPLYNTTRSYPNLSLTEVDSIVNIRKNYFTFLLTLGADQREENSYDIVYRNITNFQEYQERIYAMNFRMQEVVSIVFPEKSYEPLLTNFENNYGLKNERDFIIVFSPNSKKDKTFEGEDNLEILFDDVFFETGRSYFMFDLDDIKTANNFKYKK